MNFEIPIALYPILGIIVFAGFWGLVLTVMSRVSKWSKLADLYSDMTTGEKGDTKWLQYGQVNKWANYKGTLVFEALPAGLRIKQIWPFKIGHPNLLIPWVDIEKTGETKSRPMYNLVTLRFVRVPDVKFAVYKTTADWIVENRKKFGGR